MAMMMTTKMEEVGVRFGLMTTIDCTRKRQAKANEEEEEEEIKRLVRLKEIEIN